jgi:hypothetical protein
VCVAGHVKYMSAGERAHILYRAWGIPRVLRVLTQKTPESYLVSALLCHSVPNPPLTHPPTREATSSAKPPTFGTSPGSKSPTRRSSSVSPEFISFSFHFTTHKTAPSPCLPTNKQTNTRAHVYTIRLIDTCPSTEKNSLPRGFRAILYSTGKDPSKEKWDGASTRFEDVVSLFGADDARPLENFADDLRALVARAEHVYVDFPAPAPNSTHHNRHYRHHHHRRRVFGAGTRFPFFKYLSRQQPSSSFDDDHAETGTGSYMDVLATSMSMSKRKPLAPLVGALRSVKSECEVEVMKASAEISARAHAKTMRFAQPGLSEADLQAHFEYICARGGAQRPAYVPVVASG